MKLQESEAGTPVDVTPFVSYMNEDDARVDDDGTDLPLPDPADLAAAAPESHARRHPARPLLRDSLPAVKSGVPGDSVSVPEEDDFGAGITDGDITDGGEAPASSKKESPESRPGKRRRRRRRGRSRSREESVSEARETASETDSESTSVQADAQTVSEGGRRRRRRRRRSRSAGGTTNPGDTGSGNQSD